MDQLEGIVLFGYEMKLGWGKAMPNQGQAAINQNYLTINSVAPNIVEISRALLMNPNFPKIKVEAPENESVRSIIDCVSRLVASVHKNQYKFY